MKAIRHATSTLALNFKRGVAAMQALLAVCVACSGKPGAAERKEAGAKRSRARSKAKADVDRQAAQFGIAMGLEGNGIITLADGLEDVEITFRKPRRARWRPRGAATTSDRSCTGEAAASGSAWRRTCSHRRTAVTWDSRESDDSSSNGNSVDRFRLGADDGALVQVGDLLRIYWTEEEVWFRCRVTRRFEGTNDVEVEYHVAGWPSTRHCLTSVEWEPWEEDGEIDHRELEYDGDNYLGPVDIEARRAAAGIRKRRRASEQRSPDARGGATTPVSDCEHTGAAHDQSDDEEWTEPSRGHATRNTAHCAAQESRFGWVVAGITKGKGLKQRRALAQCIVDA